MVNSGVLAAAVCVQLGRSAVVSAAAESQSVRSAVAPARRRIARCVRIVMHRAKVLAVDHRFQNRRLWGFRLQAIGVT